MNTQELIELRKLISEFSKFHYVHGTGAWESDVGLRLNDALAKLAKKLDTIQVLQAEVDALKADPEKHLNNLRNATNILQSFINGTTSIQLAQASVNAFNEYIDAAKGNA